MILNLTDLSDEPLQSQIARQVRAKILTGELSAGVPLPSIRALAREQQVSVITVQRAYEHLLRENLIHSRRGKGFFVSELPQDRKRDMAEERLIENVKRPVLDAMAEGMTTKEIQRVIGEILKRMQ